MTTSTQSGHAINLLLNTPLNKEFFEAQKERQQSELRAKFMKALQVDKKQVWDVFQGYYNEYITCEDFEDTAEGWTEAEGNAMEESIHFAEKLEDRDNRHECLSSRNHSGAMSFR